jgi:gas vesicle protein GvpO
MSDDEQRDANGKHETAAQAARAAAAAAAVGAALGAVRALASRGDDDDAADVEENRREEEGAEDEDAVDEAGAGAEPPEEQHSDRRADEAEQAEPVEQTPPQSQSPQSPRRRERDEPKPRNGASSSTVGSVVARAREQLRDLQGRDPESVTALERIDGGWRITCEVVELERIPSSTDVLATYVVELDGDGELLQYERIRRYYRAQAEIGGDA